MFEQHRRRSSKFWRKWLSEGKLEILYPVKLSAGHNGWIQTFSCLWGLRMLTSHALLVRKALKISPRNWRSKQQGRHELQGTGNPAQDSHTGKFQKEVRQVTLGEKIQAGVGLGGEVPGRIWPGHGVGGSWEMGYHLEEISKADSTREGQQWCRQGLQDLLESVTWERNPTSEINWNQNKELRKGHWVERSEWTPAPP